MSYHHCAYCDVAFIGEPRSSIHRDGFGVGPEVPLCERCGGHVLPSCDEIWEGIARRMSRGDEIEVLP